MRPRRIINTINWSTIVWGRTMPYKIIATQLAKRFFLNKKINIYIHPSIGRLAEHETYSNKIVNEN